MQVAQYTFQSPSTSSVQVGKLDPSSVEEEKQSSKAPQESIAPAKTAGEIMSGKSIEVAPVTPTVTSPYNLDIYA